MDVLPELFPPRPPLVESAGAPEDQLQFSGQRRMDGYLGKVISYPEFYKTANGDHSIAIPVAGSDANLVNALRSPIELLDLTSFRGIGVALDADWKSSAAERFAALRQRLEQVNAEAVADGLVGFPLALPKQAGVFVDGPPRLGIHVFPDNNSQGTLENVLLACAAASHPVVHDRASQMVTSVDADCPLGDEDLKSLRTQSGKYKAHAGVISNVLRPGVESLSGQIFSQRVALRSAAT